MRDRMKITYVFALKETEGDMAVEVLAMRSG